MSKYQPLWEYIKANNTARLTFDEIEKILGFKIDHSFLNYKKELSQYGFNVGKISLKEKHITFNKMTAQPKTQLLKDPTVFPYDEVIASGLGASANDAYVKFLADLETRGILLMDWRYYNDGKAWLSKGEHRYTTVRGTAKATPLFWLSIWEGFFKVSFFFSSAQKDNLINLPIGKETKRAVETANQKGKTMRFMPVIIDVTDIAQLADIYTLAEFRKTKI